MFLDLGHFGILIGLFLVSKWLTRVLIRNAERFGLIDIPNERSSHSQPKPRGGGVSFVLTFFLGVVIFFFLGVLERDWVLPLFAGGSLVAIIGFMDDRRPLPATLRLLVHFTAASVTYLLLTKGFNIPVEINVLSVTSDVLAFLYCLLFMGWLINLYNFMDGIDGIASTQAIVVALMSASLCFWQGNQPLFVLYMLLAVTVSGFLVYNWQPAKIFMGDCGAYFLGFTFACLALISKIFSDQSLIAHMIVLGVFIVDATYTLILRLLRRQKIYQAHKNHAFQHAVQKGLSHRRVTVIYNAITILWLGPLAAASVIYTELAFLILLIAYTPLFVMAYVLKAGVDLAALDTSTSEN